MHLPSIAISALAIHRIAEPLPTPTVGLSGRAVTIELQSRDSSLIISANGQCGNCQTCLGSKYGNSCSQYDRCGSDSSYSGAGCQPDYGTCDGSFAEDVNFPSPDLSPHSTTTLTLLTTVTPVPISSELAASTSTTISYSPGTDTASSAPASSTSGPASSSTYQKVFLGNGSPTDGWPLMSQWLDFETLWSTNLAAVIAKSCAQWNVPNNSPEESDSLKSAIQSIATSNSVDPRFALAIALQESNGCVRAPTTTGSVANPGIFQSYEGTGTCNKDGSGTVPCPDSEIQQMVKDGISGTVAGSMSITDAVKKGGASGAEQYYRAARIYNSGSIAPSGLLQDGVATHCYATDITNRLLGWNTGPSGCKLNA